MYEICVSSLIAGLATCLGSFLVILLGQPKEKTFSALFGLAAGIMIAVIVIDLLPSALEQGNVKQTLVGFSLGIIIMLMLDLVLSQIFPSSKSKSSNSFFLRMGYLVLIGLAMHDLPEGIAIAAGYSAQQGLGIVIALAIGLHNIPEGMAIAAPLRMAGENHIKILALSFIVSLFTPVGSIIGLFLVKMNPEQIALLLAMAAGAMAFIVQNELLPVSRSRHPNYSTAAGIVGFLFMLLVSSF